MKCALRALLTLKPTPKPVLKRPHLLHQLTRFLIDLGHRADSSMKNPLTNPEAPVGEAYMSIATIGLGRPHAFAGLAGCIFGPEENCIVGPISIRIRNDCDSAKRNAT